MIPYCEYAIKRGVITQQRSNSYSDICVGVCARNDDDDLSN